ncbi:hypothetical protein [uncultured Desulfosarcina sp.]|uniref:hypothetical protein n=1 Tax=uncultured Desulfosarcina sp. TaxID=218289 RepID=UPI0029C8AAAE|nr:hypothetical protein [uncultured Desulfosarcina sp.]
MSTKKHNEIVKLDEIIERINSNFGMSRKDIAEQIFDMTTNALGMKVNRGTFKSTDIEKIAVWALNENVDLNWLLTGQRPHKSHICSSNNDPETTELLEMTRKVVQSNTSYGPSLKTNIRSSHQAMEAENRLQDLENRVRQIEVGSVMKCEVSGEGRPYNGPERRKGERRQNDVPGAIPGNTDRRSGTDRRVSG